MVLRLCDPIFEPIRFCTGSQGTNEGEGNCETSRCPYKVGPQGGLCAGVSPKLNMDIFTILDIYRFSEMDILRFMPDPRELINR